MLKAESLKLNAQHSIVVKVMHRKTRMHHKSAFGVKLSDRHFDDVPFAGRGEIFIREYR